MKHCQWSLWSCSPDLLARFRTLMEAHQQSAGWLDHSDRTCGFSFRCVIKVYKLGFEEELSELLPRTSNLNNCISVSICVNVSEKSKFKMSNTETSSEFVLSHHRFLPFLSVFCIISTITSEHMGKHTKAEGHFKKNIRICVVKNYNCYKICGYFLVEKIKTLVK